MPLVERRVNQKTSNHGEVRTTYTKYVQPGAVKPGDVIVEPTRKQLAELAVLYPEEYAERAKAAGIAAPAAKVQPTHEVDAEAFSEAQEQYLQLNQKQAVAFVKAEEDRELLGQLFDAERRREGGPRKAVLNAFHAQGVGHDL